MTTTPDEPVEVHEPQYRDDRDTVPVEVRPLAGGVAATASAGLLILIGRWHSPENFFALNAQSIPWSYVWSIALLAAVCFATGAVLLRGLFIGLAWFGGALVALSVVGLVEGFWFAFQVTQGAIAGQVLALARGYAVTAGIGLVIAVAATLLSRRTP